MVDEKIKELREQTWFQALTLQDKAEVISNQTNYWKQQESKEIEAARQQDFRDKVDNFPKIVEKKILDAVEHNPTLKTFVTVLQDDYEHLSYDFGILSDGLIAVDKTKPTPLEILFAAIQEKYGKELEEQGVKFYITNRLYDHLDYMRGFVSSNGSERTAIKVEWTRQEVKSESVDV